MFQQVEDKTQDPALNLQTGSHKHQEVIVIVLQADHLSSLTWMPANLLTSTRELAGYKSRPLM
jgi:hypothetical protein